MSWQGDNVVIKLSGHVYFSNLNFDLLKKLTTIILEVKNKGYRIGLVTGGGSIARSYIKILKNFGLSDSICDLIGIEVSRINAKLIASILGERCHMNIPNSYDELIEIVMNNKDKIVITGGLQPGQSTNAVAALLAETMKAKILIITTDVDGVYDRNPKKDPNAKLISEISIFDLMNILDVTYQAGEYGLFDVLSLVLLKRLGIPVYVISGYEPENILKVIMGKHIGTLIKPVRDICQ
jgi:uridylate kinase